jgi:FixJ family two-component response regulator
MRVDNEARTHTAIIDDHPSVRSAIVRLLATHALPARGYASAQAFLSSLEDETPACLITDMRMKGMTGLELLHRLAGTGLRIPTIVVTADDQPGLRHRCELAGAGAFLLKPLDAQPLLDAIRAVCAADNRPSPVSSRSPAERYLGTLSGVCRIFVKDQDHGEAVFSIGVQMKDRAQVGKGVLSGNTVGVDAALASGVAKLTLKCGETINIRMHAANKLRGLFTVEGAVPGF